MDLTQLANLGEFIGGVAVLVTLVYLAVQTRQARAAAEQTARFAAEEHLVANVSAYAQWRDLAVSNPGIAEAMAKTNAGEELSEAESIQLGLVYEQLFVAGTVGHVSSQTSGSLQPDAVHGSYVASFLKKNPGGIREWDRMKAIVGPIAPEFAASVDREIQGVRP